MMEGLGRRQVVTLPPSERDALEAIAQDITAPGTGAASTCQTCGETWWRPRSATGADCVTCCTHRERLVRGYLIKANGTAVAQALCFTCGRRGDIRRDDHGAILDVCLRDNTPVDEDHACDRCGTRGVEVHHWAPRAIFHDADSWPTANLCRRCHRQWHTAMRAARGHSLPPERRFGEKPAPWYAA